MALRPPSKHGLERKYKPWRKGKSAEKSSGGKGGGSACGSRKNRLRGQRRLLAKLVGTAGENKEAIEAVKQNIAQLEKEIAEYETRERERKYAAK